MLLVELQRTFDFTVLWLTWPNESDKDLTNLGYLQWGAKRLKIAQNNHFSSPMGGYVKTKKKLKGYIDQALGSILPL